MAVKKYDTFNGGITDYPIDCAANEFEKADNLYSNEYAKLQSRNAVRYKYPLQGQIRPFTSGRVLGMTYIEFSSAIADTELVANSPSQLKYFNGTAWQTLYTDESSQSPFTGSNDGTDLGLSYHEALSFAKWNNHTFITTGDIENNAQIPLKVFREEESGTVKVRAAGLVPTPYTGSIYQITGGSGASYIYAFVAKYTYTIDNVEFVDRSRPTFQEVSNVGTATPASSPGITVADMAYYPDYDVNNATLFNFYSPYKYPAGEVVIEVYRTINAGTTLYYSGEVVVASGPYPSYSDTVSDNTIQQNAVLYTDGGVAANDRAPRCKYVHATDNYVYWANGYEVSPTGGQYTGIDGDLKPYRMWQSKGGDGDSVPGSFFVDIEEDITGISSVKSVPIVFGANSVYRIDGVFDDFGRGGMARRKVSDSVGCVGHNSIVQTEEGIYFAGNDGFYFTDGYRVTAITNTKFRDSYKNLIVTEIDKQNLTGIHDVKNNRILWACRDSVMPGQVPQYSSFSGSLRTSKQVYENNVIYCMRKDTRTFTTWSTGYYGTGPYNTISLPGTKTVTLGSTGGISAGDLVYRTFADSEVISQSYNGVKARVVSVDSDTQITLDAALNGNHDFLASGENAYYYRNFSFIAPAVDGNGTIAFFAQNGSLASFQSDQISDLLFEVQSFASTSAATIKNIAIPVQYAGPIDSLDTTAYRKWVHGIIFKGRPRKNFSTVMAIQPYSENDDNNYKQEMRQIVAFDVYPWGTPLLSYGDPRLYRRREQIYDMKRRCPKNGLRCEYKQFHFENASVVTSNDDALDTVTVGAVGSDGRRTVTLDDVSRIWPSESENQFLSFAIDDYVEKFPILSRDSDTQITILDGEGEITASSGLSFEWRGYPYNSYLYLVEFTVMYEIIGPSQTPFRSDVGSRSGS